MSNTRINDWKMENKDTFRMCVRFQTKIHRSKESRNFLELCNQKNILPNYTKISKHHIKAAQLTPARIIQIRKQKVNESINHHILRLEKNEKNLKNLLSTISPARQID